MKVQLSRILSVGGLLFIAYSVSAAPPTKFWLPFTGSVRLGEGYSVLSGALLQSDACVEFTLDRADTTSVEWAFRRSTTLSDLVQNGGISVDAAFAIAAASTANISLRDYQSTRRFSSEDLVSANLVVRRRETAAFNPHLSIPYSLKRCGTHYVSRIVFGASVALDTSFNKTTTVDVTELSGSFDVNGPADQHARLQFFKQMQSLSDTQLLRENLKVVGTTTVPDVAGADAQTVFTKLLEFLKSLSSPSSPLLASQLGVAAIELTPFSTLGSDTEAVDKMMAWVDHLIEVVDAGQKAGLYVDGSDYLPDGQTGIIDAERAHAIQVLRNARARLTENGLLTADVSESPGSVPSPGFILSLDPATPRIQGDCRPAGGSPVLLELSGTWMAGRGGDTVRSLCDFVPGGGMICEAAGEILDLSRPGEGASRRVWLLGRNASVSFRFYDAGDYSDNSGSIRLSCRPFFAAPARINAARNAAACESPQTQATAHAQCVSNMHN